MGGARATWALQALDSSTLAGGEAPVVSPPQRQPRWIRVIFTPLAGVGTLARNSDSRYLKLRARAGHGGHR